MEDYNLQKSLGFKLELASRLTTGNFSKKLKEDKFPITPEQWGVINFLLHEDGLTQNQISKLVGKDHTCVSRLIENLIKKNIVKKYLMQMIKESISYISLKRGKKYKTMSFPL